MKKIFSLILAATLFLGCAVMTNADETDTEAEIKTFSDVMNYLSSVETDSPEIKLGLTAASAVLMEASTGKILYAANGDARHAPASVTKVMTLLIIMEELDKGTFTTEDTVTTSAHAASMGGSQVFLSEGEQITVEDLFKAICVASGNDASVAMAEHIAGVTELFVEQMNARAKQLGMNDTHFVNCTGLPAEGHVTSAWDIALMSRELILHHPDIRRFTTIWMDTLRGGSFQLSNTNKLIRFYDGATGLKTGSTDAAGFCISATAERDGMELIAVIMKGQTADKRNTDAKTLLNYGFSTYALADIAPQEPLAPVPVRLGAEDAVQPVLPSGSTLLVEKTKAGQLTQSVELPAEVEAPVAAGQALGTLTVRAGDEVLLELPLQAEQAVEKLSWGGMLTRLLRCAFLAG